MEPNLHAESSNMGSQPSPNPAPLEYQNPERDSQSGALAPPAASDSTSLDLSNDWVGQLVRVKGKPWFQFTKNAWIDDEPTLRDEGVVQGLATDDVQPVLETINAYYKERLQFFETENEWYAQTEDRLQKELDEAEEKINELKQQQQLLDQKTPPQPPSRWTLGLWIVLMLIGLVAFYPLVYGCVQEGQLFQNRFDIPIALGLLIVGSLGLWRRTSLLHEWAQPSEGPRWLPWLTESIPPFVATLMIVTLYARGQQGFDFLVIPMFLLFWAAFQLVLGRILLGKVADLAQQWKDYKTAKAQFEKSTAHQEPQVAEELAQWRQRRDALRLHLTRLRQERLQRLPNVEAYRRGFEAKIKTAQQLFLTEYHAARQARDKIEPEMQDRIRQAHERNKIRFARLIGN